MGETNKEYFNNSKEARMEAFKLVLSLFGSSNSKNRFKDICHEYWEVRFQIAHRSGNGGGENYVNPYQQSGLHNNIMETLTRLYAHLDIDRVHNEGKLGPLKVAALKKMLSSREYTAQAAKAYHYNI